MADFRNIHTRIWTDAWYSELEPDAKLLFIYLFSNPNASISGMYELPKRNIAIDTGIEMGRVTEIMAGFSAAGKVYYESGIVWVVNLKKYNDVGDGSKIAVRIFKDISAISDCQIKRSYCEYNGIPYLELKIPYSESEIPQIKKGSEKRREEKNREESESESETETLAAEKSAELPPVVPPNVPSENSEGTKSKKDPRTDHTSIQMIKRVTGAYPPRGAYDLIIRALGDSPDDEKFKLVYETWCSRGYKPMNYDGMLEWYRNGIPEKPIRQSGQLSPKPNRQEILEVNAQRRQEYLDRKQREESSVDLTADPTLLSGLRGGINGD